MEFSAKDFARAKFKSSRGKGRGRGGRGGRGGAPSGESLPEQKDIADGGDVKGPVESRYNDEPSSEEEVLDGVLRPKSKGADYAALVEQAEMLSLQAYYRHRSYQEEMHVELPADSEDPDQLLALDLDALASSLSVLPLSQILGWSPEYVEALASEGQGGVGVPRRPPRSSPAPEPSTTSTASAAPAQTASLTQGVATGPVREATPPGHTSATSSHTAAQTASLTQGVAAGPIREAMPPGYTSATSSHTAGVSAPSASSTSSLAATATPQASQGSQPPPQPTTSAPVREAAHASSSKPSQPSLISHTGPPSGHASHPTGEDSGGLLDSLFDDSNDRNRAVCHRPGQLTNPPTTASSTPSVRPPSLPASTPVPKPTAPAPAAAAAPPAGALLASSQGDVGDDELDALLDL